MTKIKQNDRQVHVMHVIQRLAMGGLENGLVNLVNQLPADQFKHTIVSLTDATEFAARILPGKAEVICLHGRGGIDLRLWWKFYRLLMTLRPHIVHTRNMAALETQSIAILARIPIRIHGEHGWDMADLNGGKFSYHWMRKLLFPFLQQIVVLSSHQQLFVQSRFRFVIPKLKLICNGVDVQQFVPAEPMDKVTPSDQKIVIGCVGRMEVVKNHQFLIQAYAEMLRAHPEYIQTTQLHLVGNGSQRAHLQHQIERLKLDLNVMLFAPTEDTLACYQGWQIYALPSLAEGISNTLLEAMACGLPLVATDVGGNSDLIEEGSNGKLVAVADVHGFAAALATYISNPRLREQQGQAGRQRSVERFSLVAMAQHYGQMYQTAFQQASGILGA